MTNELARKLKVLLRCWCSRFTVIGGGKRSAIHCDQIVFMRTSTLQKTRQ